MLKRKGIATKRKQREHFQVSSRQWRQQTHEKLTPETTIKRTECLGNADGFSKGIWSTYKKGREEDNTKMRSILE